MRCYAKTDAKSQAEETRHTKRMKQVGTPLLLLCMLWEGQRPKNTAIRYYKEFLIRFGRQIIFIEYIVSEVGLHSIDDFYRFLPRNFRKVKKLISI